MQRIGTSMLMVVALASTATAQTRKRDIGELKLGAMLVSIAAVKEGADSSYVHVSVVGSPSVLTAACDSYASKVATLADDVQELISTQLRPAPGESIEGRPAILLCGDEHASANASISATVGAALYVSRAVGAKNEWSFAGRPASGVGMPVGNPTTQQMLEFVRALRAAAKAASAMR